MSRNNTLLALVVVGSIIFFVFFMPLIEKNYRVEGLDNTLTATKFDQAPCSQDCCNWQQWPVPFQTYVGDIPQSELSNYVSTNMTCTNGARSGCVCATKKDFNDLSNRGGNGSSQPAISTGSCPAQ